MSAFTENLIVSPLPDGKTWVLRKKFSYDVGEIDSGETIEVPAGFVTDFASIPRVFWWILPRWGKYGNAAIIHDYLYWIQDDKEGTQYDRKRADEIFHEGMGVLNVGKSIAKTMYRAVRLGGQIAWNRNAKAKKQGKTRFLNVPDEMIEISKMQLKDLELSTSK